MSDNRDDTFLARWLNNELSEEEKREFEASAEYSEYQKIIAGTKHIEKEEFDMDSILSNVKESKKFTLRPASPMKTWKAWGYGIAASLALLVGFFFLYDPGTVVKAGIGEQQVASLPGGSQVVLNAGSTLTYNANDWEKKREVKLEGEAYFKVKPGSQFSVISGGGKVTVLGTEFNVWDAQGLFQVTCYEGSVSVLTSKSDNTLTLGQSFLSLREEETLSDVEEKQPGWTLQRSSFKSVPVRYVLKALENQFNLQFEYTEFDGDQRFTGSFPHADKQTALEIVLGSLQINYRQKDSRTVILGD